AASEAERASCGRRPCPQPAITDSESEGPLWGHQERFRPPRLSLVGLESGPLLPLIRPCRLPGSDTAEFLHSNSVCATLPAAVRCLSRSPAAAEERIFCKARIKRRFGKPINSLRIGPRQVRVVPGATMSANRHLLPDDLAAIASKTHE